MDVPWAYSSSDTRVGRASIPSTQVIPETALTVPSTPTVLIGESHLLDRLRSYQAFSLYSPKGALRKIATTTKGKKIYTHKS